MKSQQFYQPITGHAIPLTLLNLAEYETFQPCSDSERRTLAVMQFGAKLGEMALIWDESGALSKVYMGAGESSDAVALATAALKLPPGTYQITNAVSERAVLMWALAQYRFDHFQKVLPLPRVLAINPQYLPKVVNG